VALAHLSWRDGPLPLRLPPQSLTLSLPANSIQRTSAKFASRGVKVQLIQRLPGNTPCRLTPDPWLLLEQNPTFVISGGIHSAAEIPVISRAVGAKQLDLMAFSNLEGAPPLCAAKPRVTYGSGD
jgi:hypothetical protein